MFSRSLFIFLSIILFSVRCFSIEPYRVHYLGIEKGLSNNAVTSIYQDDDGFMWFSTYDGLNKYDGTTFTVFRNKIGDTASLLGNEIFSLAGDIDHNIWIGGPSGACIYHRSGNIFSVPKYIPQGGGAAQKVVLTVNNILANKNGDVFIGAKNVGLLVFGPHNEVGMQVPLRTGKTYTNNYRVTVLTGNNEIVWLLVDNVGLCKYNKTDRVVELVNASIGKGNSMVMDGGKLWLGNNNGLFQYDVATNAFSANYINDNYKVSTLCLDKTGKLWIGTDGKGAFILDQTSKQLKSLLSADGKEIINSSAVYSIYEDGAGRKWIGTLRGGINVIDPKPNPFKWMVYNDEKTSNPNMNYILSFCEDRDSNIWIGTDGGGLRYWNRKTNQYQFYNHDAANKTTLGSNFVTGVLSDANNDIWVSTWFGGVNKLNKSNRSFEHYVCYNPYTKNEEKQVWLVYEDKSKRLWASTSNDGTLYILNRQTNRFELFDSSIVNIQYLAEDKNGTLWGGNYSSLIRIDTRNKAHVTYKLGYTVRCIHEDTFGNFWVGTQGGGLLLFDRKNGTYKRFDETAGLQGNTILRILEDVHGNLWMSSFTGLIKYDAQEKAFKKFSQSDGLQSNQFSFNAATALRSGEFIFGGIKGFNMFYPDSVYGQASKPQVYLTAIRVNGEPLDATNAAVQQNTANNINEIIVPYDKASLSFDFVAPEYSFADKLRYSYYLEGWDKAPNNSGIIKTATYSSLPEGTYYFNVKVTNVLGIWGNDVALIKITVLPPWYRTWWAYIIYFGMIGMLVYLYVRYKSNQANLKYQVKLANITAEKEKELTEKKIAFFTHVSHEFRTPLTLIINPLKERVLNKNGEQEDKGLALVYRNAKRLLSLVDQLLLFRKVEGAEQQMRMEQFNLATVCDDVYLCFQQYAVSKYIHFSITGNETTGHVYADKEKIEIVLFNLFSNAFKFTPNGGAISIAIETVKTLITITVTDTGCGIPETVGSRLFQPFYQVATKESNHPTGFGIGLYLSKKLAEANGGTLNFTSKIGEGSSFVLALTKVGADLLPIIPKQNGEKTSLVETQKITEEEHESTFLEELMDYVPAEEALSVGASKTNKADIIDKLTSELPSMLIVDDNADMRELIKAVFIHDFHIYEATDGDEGYELALKEVPDIIVSDITMQRVNGIELCANIKANPAIGHIPVILLTASSSADNKLKGIEGGADDYITKPFDNEIIKASIKNILQRKNRLQQYFFNAVTLQPNFNIAGEYKAFIEQCIAITEKYLDDPDFNIKTFSREIGMSHPKLYKKVKAVSGLSVNVFIRYLRLKKAAELLINTNKTINEVTYDVGFRDIKYFREQFNKLFEMNPSEYVKRYRKSFGNKMNV